MSDQPETARTNEPEHAHEHKLPNEGVYFAVFILLALLTLAELLATYLPVVKVPLLLGLAVAKATLVVQFYMHLRYDKRIMAFSFLLPVIIGVLITIFIQPLVNSYR